MDKMNFLDDWEQNKLPAFQALYSQALKLQKAIHSQGAYGPGQENLEFEFNDWFKPLHEQLCALLDGAIPDMLAGYHDAIVLVSKAISELPANQEMYRRLLRQFNRLLESPI